MPANNTKIPFVFFGTPEFAVGVLEALKEKSFMSALIVTAPDKPAGRRLVLTPPLVKVWADEHDIPTLQPEIVGNDFIQKLQAESWKLFIVAAYGKILPKKIIEMPEHGSLNVHPSLLPKLRGAAPIQTAILEDKREDVGVTIMLMDEKMDHGPVVAQARIEPDPWPPKATDLEALLAQEGGNLLAEALPYWVNREITPEPQNHDEATFTKKITKEDGELAMESGLPATNGEQGWQNFLKIQAFDRWPGAYFFTSEGKRIKVTEASFADDVLAIEKVTPEGKREMSYRDFLVKG